MRRTNHWNRLAYRLWAPIYDSTINGVFVPGRIQAMDMLALRPGERVLLVGVGTGADIPLLPAGISGIGVDLSPEMLAKGRLKLGRSAASVELIRGDAQTLPLEEERFDAAVLNLILSVVPDGNSCLKSTLRALKPGGRAVIFDKFLPEGREATAGRRLMNFFSMLLGTDINRSLSDIMRDCNCAIIRDEPSIWGGMYRVVLLKRR